MRTGLARVILGAVLVASGCSGPEPVRHVLLITVDTTRADRIGCYGYEAARTPHLDALARDGVLFSQAQASVPVTLPSHATMFTGQYPPVHGIRYNGMFRLEESSVTVAELLSADGWVTAGVASAFPLTASTGIAQGFAFYSDLFEGAQRRGQDLPPTVERKADEVTQFGLQFLRGQREGRTLLWLHYFDPHYPYEPPFPYSAEFRDHPYDGEIAFMDAEIGKVLDELEVLGIRDRTLVIVAGDHGEGLWDHGEKMHSNLAYQSTLHVPLIVRMPGTRPGVVDAPVSLADVAPTVLEAAGLPIPEMDGRSLLPLLRGEPGDAGRSVYFEALAGSLVYGWSPLEGVRTGRYKYLRGTSPELYDLEADPGERDNLLATHPEVASDLEQDLGRLSAAWSEIETDAAPADVPLDDRQRAMLESLGYVQGDVSVERRGGPDPRQMIHLEVEVLRARDLMDEERNAEALAVWREVLDQDPTNRHALQQAAACARRMMDLDTALELSRRTLEHYPEFLPAILLQADVHIAQGRLDEARRTFADGLARYPDNAVLTYKQAATLNALGRSAEALELLDPAIAAGRGAELPAYLVLQAVCRANLGNASGAAQALRQAIDNGYRDRELLETEPLFQALRALKEFPSELERIPA